MNNKKLENKAELPVIDIKGIDERGKKHVKDMHEKCVKSESCEIKCVGCSG